MRWPELFRTTSRAVSWFRVRVYRVLHGKCEITWHIEDFGDSDVP